MSDKSSADALSKLFKDCQKKSAEILKLSVQILEEIQDVKSNIYSSLKAEYSYIPTKKIQQCMVKSVDRLINDAESFLKDKDSLEILDDLEDNYPEYAETYPFVVGIWSGDIYDQCEIKGFYAFKKELDDMFTILNDEKLFLNFLRKNYLDTY